MGQGRIGAENVRERELTREKEMPTFCALLNTCNTNAEAKDCRQRH